MIEGLRDLLPFVPRQCTAMNCMVSLASRSHVYYMAWSFFDLGLYFTLLYTWPRLMATCSHGHTHVILHWRSYWSVHTQTRTNLLSVACDVLAMMTVQCDIPCLTFPLYQWKIDNSTWHQCSGYNLRMLLLVATHFNFTIIETVYYAFMFSLYTRTCTQTHTHTHTHIHSIALTSKHTSTHSVKPLNAFPIKSKPDLWPLALTYSVCVHVQPVHTCTHAHT